MNGLIIVFRFVIPANTGIRELFELVPGLRREDA